MKERIICVCGISNERESKYMCVCSTELFKFPLYILLKFLYFCMKKLDGPKYVYQVGTCVVLSTLFIKGACVPH